MSSLKHAVKRRVHLERAQPERRKKLGLLEKKDDYRTRAKAYRERSKHLRELREAASNRNKDEFNYGMIKARMKGGRFQKLEDPLPDSQIKLAVRQDKGVLMYHATTMKNRLKGLTDDLHFLSVEKENSHVLYDSDGGEAPNKADHQSASDFSEKLRDVAIKQDQAAQFHKTNEELRDQFFLLNKKERHSVREDLKTGHVFHKWKYERKK
eukprot:GHVN01063478.1.p1 GENE.GHVN01063478.1~~GHVN01063478.1.p1  ORF type:complete len:210 (+),score=31.26 GHVN01063478.1:57-686(+)